VVPFYGTLCLYNIFIVFCGAVGLSGVVNVNVNERSGFASRPGHYSTGHQLWASCLLTLLPQSSQLQETGTKASIRNNIWLMQNAQILGISAHVSC